MADDDERIGTPPPEDAAPQAAEAPVDGTDAVDDADAPDAVESAGDEEPRRDATGADDRPDGRAADAEETETDEADSDDADPAAAEPEPGEGEPADSEPADAAPAASGPRAKRPARAPRAPRRPGIGRTVTVISFRVVRGLVGVAAAVLVIGAVGLVPLRTTGIEPLETTVQPQPADLLEACTGSLLRLGDDTGANAGQASPLGTPTLSVASYGGTPQSAPLAESEAGTGGGDQAPRVLQLAAGGGTALAGAQAQASTGGGGLRGLAAAACREPASSAWLVGGATTVGRTTLLLLVNPTAVNAEVTVQIWSESGPVVAQGMSGIVVGPGSQRIIPLSGFAPDLASPVVHVEARGGRVVAALQTSVIRVLDPGGVDLVSAGASPARETIVPGVRILDELGVRSSLGIDDHADLDAIARVGNPGDSPATVEVSITPTVAGGTGASFDLTVPAGSVTDVSLSSGFQLGQEPMTDGSYTVSFRSDEPVVAAVRASTTPTPATAADGSPEPGPVDLAWFAASPRLRGDVLLSVAQAPSPVLVVVNPDNAERTLTLEPVDGGAPLELALPAAGSAGISLEPGAGYLLRDADGLRAAMSFAATGRLAGYPIAAPRQADSPIVVRP